jgi:hypothetical protein
MYIPCSMPTNFKFPFFLNTLVGALLTWHKWNLKGGKRCWSNIILWFASCGYFNLFPLLIRSCNRAYYAWTNETSSWEFIWQILKSGKTLKGPFRRVIVLQWKVNDKFWIFFNIVHIQYIYELCTNLIFIDIQKESEDLNIFLLI